MRFFSCVAQVYAYKKQEVFYESIHYIRDYLEGDWQDAIGGILIKEWKDKDKILRPAEEYPDEIFTQYSDKVSKIMKINYFRKVSLAIRVFPKDTQNKTYVRYYKKKEIIGKYSIKEEYLHIDPVFIAEDYEELDNEEIHRKLCDDLYHLLEYYLLKYKKRFSDFDIEAFLPFLKERLLSIKERKFPTWEEEKVLRAQQPKVEVIPDKGNIFGNKKKTKPSKTKNLKP